MNPVHFSLEEFLHSDTALANGIPNTPTWDVVDNLKRLGGVMDQIRGGAGGCPVTILSGYRSPDVNALVGGATNSAHLVGLACDFIIPGYGSPLDICRAIEPHLLFLGIDQLIWEYGDWVHMGLAGEGCDPKCECLTINDSGTSWGFP